AYVDVAFRQQSQWNEKVVSALVMLAQNLHKSDYAVRLHELEQRVRKLEKLLRRERQRRLIQKRQILESAESTRRHPPREGKEL
ncbi:MAG TPA: hypothetical protein PKA06_16265, partial [Gemmatales bacterium]|nr:hypothetical protein [Gemmatales bacterium]